MTFIILAIRYVRKRLDGKVSELTFGQLGQRGPSPRELTPETPTRAIFRVDTQDSMRNRAAFGNSFGSTISRNGPGSAERYHPVLPRTYSESHAFLNENAPASSKRLGNRSLPLWANRALSESGSSSRGSTTREASPGNREGGSPLTRGGTEGDVGEESKTQESRSNGMNT